MRKRIATLLLALALPIVTDFGIVKGMAQGWEPVRVERSDVKTIVRESEVEIKSAPGIIQVSTNHPIQIKIFTILGRLVNSETLPQGTMQFSAPAHGVYIVKVGEITCKVAV